MNQQLTRRSILCASVAAGVSSVAGCLDVGSTAADQSPDSWPMFQNGPEHRGRHRTASGPGETLQTDWRRTATELAAATFESVDEASLSLPTVADGTVYAVLWGKSGDEVHDLRVVGFDGNTGELDRTIRIPNCNPVSKNRLSRPVIVDGTLYLTIRHVLENDPLVVLDVDTGTVNWREESDVNPRTDAVVRDELIVVGAGDNDTAVARTTAGETAWSFGDEVSGYQVAARSDWPPTVTDDRVYLPTSNGLYALGHDGSERWHRELGFEDRFGDNDPLQVTTPVVGERVYVVTCREIKAGDGKLVALDPATGDTVWQFQPDFDRHRRRQMVAEYYERVGSYGRQGIGVYGAPALADGTLYVPGLAMPAEDGLLTDPQCYAIDADTGNVQWSTDIRTASKHTPPVVADGVVYLPCGYGIIAVDADSGERLAEVETRYPYGLALASGSVYAGDRTVLERIA